MKTILVDAIHAFFIKGEGIYQPLYDLLESYPNPKIILTGASKEQIKIFGLVNMPYEVFTLQHNPEKVDPLYFQTFLQKYNLRASDVIYFEHNTEACKSAKSLGITTHYYDKDTQDLDSLKEFLDNNA